MTPLSFTRSDFEGLKIWDMEIYQIWSKTQNFRLRRPNTVIFKGKTALLEGKQLKIFACGALIR